MVKTGYFSSQYLFANFTGSAAEQRYGSERWWECGGGGGDTVAQVGSVAAVRSGGRGGSVVGVGSREVWRGKKGGDGLGVVDCGWPAVKGGGSGSGGSGRGSGGGGGREGKEVRGEEEKKEERGGVAVVARWCGTVGWWLVGGGWLQRRGCRRRRNGGLGRDGVRVRVIWV
nr:loricrin-like [Arachis hypogaea]